MNNVNILKNKEFYEFCEGNVKFFKYNNKELGLPYLTTNDLINICNEFGVKDIRNLSRWGYVEALFIHLDENNRMQDFFNWLFDKKRFKFLIDTKCSDINKLHKEIVNAAIELINKKISLADKKLIYINGIYDIVDIDSDMPIELYRNKINNNYVYGLVDRTLNDFDNGNYDSVITKSRTLIEEVLVYILESNGIEFDKNGEVHQYYKKVKTLFNMQKSNDFDERINKLLGGLETIINSIAEMRNKNSDSHAAGSKRIKIRKSECVLIRDATTLFCNYILTRNQVYLEIENDN